jgi:hypothetical protein
MCFPNKWSKKNFDDDEKPTKSKAKAAATPAAEKTDSHKTDPSTTTTLAPKVGGPKIAIVIYSMYGHITKSMFHCCRTRLTSNPASQWLKPSSLVSRAMEVLQQYTSIYHSDLSSSPTEPVPESPRHFLKKFWLRCTHQPNQITLLSPSTT